MNAKIVEIAEAEIGNEGEKTESTLPTDSLPSPHSSYRRLPNYLQEDASERSKKGRKRKTEKR